jgi:hypothetical protein
MVKSWNGLRSESGFSMAEVVVAIVLFVASIVGISMMLVSGGQNVARGAKDTTAANLATQKIEEVKALPFYLPWSGTNGDMDDHYWSYNGSTPRPNNQQFANPVVEDYGAIAGYGTYRRTTAVKYVYVSGGILVDAAMDTNWVPKAPTGAQIDRPTGGPVGGPYQPLHGIMIEVKVYYRDANGGEKSFSEQGLAGDLMVTGGTNAPPLVINSLNPQFGYYGDSNFQMVITVSTQPGTLNASSILDVWLWYPGKSNVHAKSVPAPIANAAGTQITCYFDLRGENGIRPGMYNLSVYWADGGWLAQFRDDVFEVRTLPPEIHSIANFTWGYGRGAGGQTSRQITVTGANLYTATIQLKGPNPSNAYTIPGTVTSNNGTTLTATFNLTGGNATSRAPNSVWDLEINTPGGTVITNEAADRFTLNPTPTITSVQSTSSPSYYNWAYKNQTSRNVRINGTYLYGFNDGTNRWTHLYWNGMESSQNATYVSGPTGNDCNHTDPVVLTFNPSNATSSVNPTDHPEVNNTRWDIKIGGNWGTAQSDVNGKRVWMNPPPTMSNPAIPVANWPASPYTGTRNGNQYAAVRVNGNYLQTGAMAAVVRNNPPSSTTTYNVLNGGSLNADGTAITGMTLNVNVNPMTNSFRVWGASGWGASTQNDNAQISGSYYVYWLNPDGQYVISASAATINHATYSIACTATPSGWGTVSGAGTFYQDQAWSITANPVSSSGQWLGAFRVWQEPPGTDQWGYGYPLSGTATANRSFNCRFSKWFYHGDYTGGPNFGSFVQSVNDSPYDNIQTARVEGSYRILWVNSKASMSFLSTNTGEVAARTNSQVSYAGASTLWWYAAQSDGNNNGANNWSTVCSSTGTNDRYNVGQMWGSSDVFGYDWRSMNVSGRANGYLHINSRTDYSIWGGNNTAVRTRYVFME